jgi:hypothetical protein
VITTIDTNALLKVVWVSLAAGVTITTSFSFALYSYSRFAEARANGVSGALQLVAALTGLAVFLGAIAYGLTIVVQK